MEIAYNEEELLLRLLVGAVLPLLLLVALRMTSAAMRRWERRWKGPAADWARRVVGRSGIRNPESVAKRLVSALLGIERAIAFGLAALLIAIAWFILFPQTRSLALEFARSIVAPLLGVASALLKGLLAIAYSVAVLAAAITADGRIGKALRRDGSTRGLRIDSPLAAAPLRIAVWIAAAFLLLLPYPGLPRILGLGLALLGLLATLIAARPIIEQMAIGHYLRSSLALAPGAILVVDGERYTIEELRAAHALLESGGRKVSWSYSRLLAASLETEEGSVDA